MKKHLFLTLLLSACTLASFSQQRVTERQLLGDWKLMIDIEEEMRNAEAELDEEESILGTIIFKSVSGVVEGILDGLDIYMNFQPDGVLEVTVNAFGTTETEYSSWYIRDGKLYLQDTDSFQSDKDDYFMLEDGNLISFDGAKRNPNVYLVSMK